MKEPRLYVSPDRLRAVCRHYLDSRDGTEYADWIDCTDMSDEEFFEFMTAPAPAL